LQTIYSKHSAPLNGVGAGVGAGVGFGAVFFLKKKNVFNFTNNSETFQYLEMV